MKKGLTQAVLGVMGAALLSGSVFAAGPTITTIPDFIVTDRDPFGAFDSPDPATTANRYRFTEAFRISDYINYTPVDGTDTVSFIYTEHDYDDAAIGGAGAQRTGGDKDLTIGQIAGSDTAAASIDATVIQAEAPVDFQDVLSSNIAYEIGNVARSGGDPAVGAGPGELPAFADHAVVQVFVTASAPSTGGAVASRTFNVYTTNDVTLLGLEDQQDQLSIATTVFVPTLLIEEFGGWYDNIQAPATQGSGNFEFYQGGPDVGPQPIDGQAQWITNNPPIHLPTGGDLVTAESSVDAIFDRAVAAPGTESLTAGTLANPGTTTSPYAPQFAVWSSYRPDLAETVALDMENTPGEDDLYVVRWRVSGSNAAFADRNRIPDVRFQVGELSESGIGVQQDLVLLGGANSLRGPGLEHRQYVIGLNDQPVNLHFSILDLFQSSAAGNISVDYELELEEVLIMHTTRSQLASVAGDPAPVVNQGANSFSLASGTASPPSGNDPFDFDDWRFSTENLTDFGAPTPATPRTTSTGSTGDLLRLNFSTTGNFFEQGAWSTTQQIEDAVLGLMDAEDVENIVSAGNDQLVWMDVWMSSPDAGGALPIMKVGFASTQFGQGTSSVLADGIGEGRAAFLVFEGGASTNTDLEGNLVDPVIDLQTAARRYSVAIEPQVRVTTTGEGAGSDPIAELHLTVEPYVFAAGQGGTIDIHRVVVHVYDLPPFD